MKKLIFLMVSIALTGIIFWSCSSDSSSEPSNKAPSCNITQPSNGTEYTLGTIIDVTVSADDEDGSIESVKIFLNGNIADTLVQSPYNYQIDTSNLTAGNLEIKAIASDNEGEETKAIITVLLKSKYDIKLISPNGNENFPLGTSQIITWESNLHENVKIVLKKSGSLSYEIIASTSNDGQYSWAIPTSLALSSDYKIEISGVTSTNVSDQSDNNFILTAASNDPFVTVLSPNGNENWLNTTTKEIRWVSNFTDDITIELYKNNSFVSTITSQAVNSGSYNWVIPSTVTNGDNYKIKVLRKVDELIYDYSDENYNMGNIIITYPNGYELFEPTSSCEIQWLSSISNTIDIYLYKDDISYRTIVTNINSNLNSYNWTVPYSTADSLYKVVIKDRSTSNILDQSNDNFGIEPKIVISKLNGNEWIIPNYECEIQWGGNVNGPVQIDLYKSGVFHSNISNSQLSSPFIWIPSDQTIGNDFSIRVSNQEESEYYDESDDNFTISDQIFRKYGGNLFDGGSKVHQTTDNGFAIIGSTQSFGAGEYDVWLIKTDENGNELWNKTFGDTENDNGASIQLTKDGGYIIAGNTASYGAGDYDIWLIKTDNLGNEEWNKTFGGTEKDGCADILQTSDGGYLIIGYTFSYGAGGLDAYLIKTDANGNEIWSKTFGGNENDQGRSIQSTKDGGYIIGGNTYSFGAGNRDIWLIKTDANGNEIWSNTYGSSDSDYLNSLHITTDDGYIIAASSYNPYHYPRIIKIDISGNTEWDKDLSYEDEEIEHCFSVLQESDGSYLALCGGYYWGTYFVKTDVSGNKEWYRYVENLPEARGACMQKIQSGGYIITGSNGNYNATPPVFDVILLEFDPERIK